MTDKLIVTDDQLDALRQQHGRVTRVASPAGDLVFRAPTGAEESAFQASRFGTTSHPGIAWRTLMVTTVVSPDRGAFVRILEQWPALNINTRITDALRVLRGEVNDDEVK